MYTHGLLLDDNHNESEASALTVRQKFSDYFSSEEGSVPWQDKMINR